jgi:ATP-binding cassette subfamily B protein
MQRSSDRRLVLTHLRPPGRSAAALVAAVLATTVLPLLAPQLTRRIVDGAMAGDPTGSLLVLAGLYLAVAVVGQLARVGTAWLASRLAWDGTNRLRERLAEHALDLDLGWHAQRTPGEMIERVDGDVVALADFVVALLLDVVASVLLLIGVLALVTLTDARIGLVLWLYVVVVSVFVFRLQRRAVPAATALRSATAGLFGHVEERLNAIEDIRANGAGAHVVNRFHEASAEVYRADLRAERASGMVFVLTSLAFAGATAMVLALAVLGYRASSLTVGTLVLLFQYTQMVRHPVERIIDQIEQYQKALAGVARISQLLGEQPGLRPPAGGGRHLAEGPLALELDDVSFAYASDDHVIRHVRLRLGAGRSLGLVGRTGSGKSTVARLLLRLYDPTDGAVRVGGIDLREADPASLRRRVAMVTQDVQLFAASVRDNLALFRSAVSADEARLHAALTEVGLWPWFDSLPDGLDSLLGPGGTGLSAGEAQLLALARAFLADPGLVVLDEPSSRLDPATEALIEEAIGRLLRGRTAVVIAHRLSSLDRVDEIAVVEDGALVEYGPRAELVADPDSRFSGLLAMARSEG